MIDRDINNKIIKSPSNINKMTYWEVWREWCGYKTTVKIFLFDLIHNFAEEIWTGIKAIYGIVLWFILFPVLPFIKVYLLRKEAREFESRQKEQMGRVFKNTKAKEN